MNRINIIFKVTVYDKHKVTLEENIHYELKAMPVIQ